MQLKKNIKRNVRIILLGLVFLTVFYFPKIFETFFIRAKNFCAQKDIQIGYRENVGPYVIFKEIDF
jgi:hypothetical protein